MKQIKYKSAFIIVLMCIAIGFNAEAQIKKENIKLGITYGTGSQNRFPFNSKDYSHDIVFYKAQINYRFKQFNKWSFEASIEPSFNIIKHQLLNKWFIKESDAENYLELRDLYTKERTLKEYVLNLGIIVRYSVYKNISIYALGGSGPMIGNIATERLTKGFAFSDVFGLGLSYEINKILLDVRYTIRHTSNFELKIPNNGHNTSNTEFTIFFCL